MRNVFLGLGTNMGDRQAKLTEARLAIESFACIEASSSIYETAAWGFESQDPFLNQVIQIETTLSAIDLLKRVKQVEKELGRVESFRWGPRLIDIDILFYGHQVINLASLAIPHKHLHERAFVLVPMAEIAPEFVHPLLNQTVLALRDALPNLEGVELWKYS